MDAFEILSTLAKDLKVLYVEDEKDLQNTVAETLKYFYKEVLLANNGEEGIEMYLKYTPDLVISDIKMPKKTGLELIQEIKEISPKQRVIITSAYGDEDNLFKMIDLGVDGFIKKPLDQDRFMNTLIDVAILLKEDKLEKFYENKLKESNQKLEQTNTELRKVVKVLENKLKQLAMPTLKKRKEEEAKKREDEKKPKEDNYEKLIPEDLDELKELESDIDYIISKVVLNQKFRKDEIKHLSDKLNRYASVLIQYYSFTTLGQHIHNLSSSIKTNAGLPEEKIIEAFNYAESFIYVLGKWRSDTIENNSVDKVIYESSIISDIAQIISSLEGKDEDLDGEIEFF